MAESKKRSRSGSKGAGADTPVTFEDTVQRLEGIVERLESGSLPLEDSLALFEEGVGLARASQEQLDRAERRVAELLGIDDDGNPIVRDLDEAKKE
jgi:exodeoxyribonuclease VII small subunit